MFLVGGMGDSRGRRRGVAQHRARKNSQRIVATHDHMHVRLSHRGKFDAFPARTRWPYSRCVSGW